MPAGRPPEFFTSAIRDFIASAYSLPSGSRHAPSPSSLAASRSRSQKPGRKLSRFNAPSMSPGFRSASATTGAFHRR